MKKRILSLFLALALLIGMLPVTVKAEKLDNGLEYFLSQSSVQITGYYGDETVLVIPSEIAGRPVTSIDHYAFQNCSGLTSISIPDSVTSIGQLAFGGCSSLSSIDLPEGLTSIESMTFSGCSSLTSIDIPDTVASIDQQAFQNCTGLVSVDLPDSLTSIGDSAFRECTSLTEIDIPDTVTSIGTYAFYRCKKLTEIRIPEGVSSLNYYSFYYCTSLTTVSLPESLTSIGNYAFTYCASLTSINFPDAITSIGNQAFRGCSGLTGIDFPGSLTSIGNQAFEDCTGLTHISFQSGLTSLGAWAFDGCSSLSAIFFTGDAPSFGSLVFSGVTATACYPSGNTTWKEGGMGNQGGTLTWVPYDPSHPHEYDAVVTAPTCTEQGFTAYTCECGARYVADYVEALGHDYIDDSCSRCGDLTAGLVYTVYEDYVEITDYTSSAAKLVIPAEIEGKPVTHIGSSAFSGCSHLTGIVIPDSVTSIGNYAFQGSGLIEIDLPEGITSIGNSTFAQCSDLVDVDIPDIVISIGDFVFDGCYSLADVDIPDGVTSIGSYAFRYCESLTSIDLPEGITSIEISTFNGCTSLTGIVIPKGVTFIDSYAFKNCENLTGIVIPDSVASIKTLAFQNCTGLTFICFEGSAPQLGENVFKNISTLALYPPDNTTWTEAVLQSYGGEITWGVHDSSHLPELETVITEPTCTEQGFTTYTCVCGSSYISNHTAALGHNFTYGVCSLCGIPESGLQYTIHEDYVEITGYSGNEWKLVIPGEIEGLPVTLIGDSAFYENSTLTTIDLPEGITSIGNSAFYECRQLVSVDIPDSVTHLGNSAFENCFNLASAPLPENLKQIGNAAFKECGVLTGIEIPDGVTYIGNSAFAYCEKLTSLSIPEGITYIASDTFMYCSSLTSITLPDSLTSIGDFAFFGCYSLPGIHIPDSVTSIGIYAFNECKKLTGISIPDGVASIKDFAFYGCSSLASIDLPDSVTSIGHRSFVGCTSLTRIDLPKKLTSIGWNAFYNCANLTDIIFNGNAPQFDTDVFYGVTATAYYPTGNATWTEDVMQDYGGTITWVPLDLSHTHEYTAVVTAPTCTEQGFTTYTCACGDTYTADPVDALGHDFADGACILCGEADPNYQEPVEPPFDDVPTGAFYEEPVRWALENGITTGTSPNTFSPDDHCLRAHVVTFLWRAERTPEPSSYSNSFTDVTSDDFFYKPVLWALEKDITTGISPTSFGAYSICNRAQVVTFLWRAKGCPEPTSTDNPFADVTSADFFYKPVLWALENGITTGISPTEFGSNSPCNRAQVVTFLYRAYN